MKEERLVDGYYQSNIKTSRNEDSVYAMKYASQQILIDKLEEENKSLQSQLKAKEEENEQLKADYGNLAQVERDFLKEVIKEAKEYIETNTCWDLRTSKILEILSKGEKK